MVTRNSVTWSFSTTTLSSAIQAPLIPWTVSAAFAIPVFAASAKLVGDEAVISITLATLMAASSVGDVRLSYPRRDAGKHRLRAPRRRGEATLVMNQHRSICRPSVEI